MVHHFQKLLIISLLLGAVNPFSVTSALAASMLRSIARNDQSSSLTVLLQFDQVPGFKLATSGRRIDLELAETAPVEPLPLPAIDARMIKVVSTVKRDRTLLSFYFRYPPQKVSSESDKSAGVLKLDILLGTQVSVTSPELPVKPQGASQTRQAPSGLANPVGLTPYAKNWTSFFTDYESPFALAPAPRLTLPPFPLAADLPPQTGLEQWLPAEIQAQARDNRWTQTVQMLRQQVERQPNEPFRERLVLSYAEALVRAGEYRQPYFLLQRIMIQYPDSLMADLANLLLIYQQGARGDHVNAYYELAALVKKIENTPQAAAPALHLLQAELALKAGRTADAEQLLADPALVREAPLSDLRQLRLADLSYAKKEKDKAMAAYQELTARSPLPEQDLMSLANFSDGLYSAKRYSEAAKRYQLLADQLNNQPGQDLALFRLSMCQLHIPGSEKRARIDLQQIHEAFANTRGGDRALLKQTDLDYLAKRLEPAEAEKMYRKFANLAEEKDLREEASFKIALVRYRAGEHGESVIQCMELLREFQAGRLRTEAMALLIQQLPGVIRQSVKNGEYVKALVLAKQNKKYFLKGWLDTGLLYDLAKAYNQLGMFAQTAQTYQYLFDVSTDADKEKIYLPLIQALFGSRRYAQVEEYADRYLDRYPKGVSQAAIFELKARALAAGGEFDKALKMLNQEQRPRLPQLDLLKGRLYYETKQWDKAIETLSQPSVQPLLAPRGMLLPLAEAYFHTGQLDQAAPLYRRAVDLKEGHEQALFRLAQIELSRDNSQQALNLFKELADKGKDPLWTRLAREEQAILEMHRR